MSETDKPLNFISSEQRSQWLIQNADYFTVVRRVRRTYERHERPTLEEARRLAKSLVDRCGQPFMIYAVKGVHDTWVENVMPEEVKHAKGKP